MEEVRFQSGETMIDRNRYESLADALTEVDDRPTTLVDALTRYVNSLATQGEPSHEIGGVLADLTAILDYPWSGKEIQDAKDEESDLDFIETDNRNLEIRLGGRVVALVNWEDAGSGGVLACQEVAQAVYFATLLHARREHDVQLSQTDVTKA